jgi:methionyl-tRNA synthetase
VAGHIEKVELRAGLRAGMDAAAEVNAYLNATEPWRVLKEDSDARILAHFVDCTVLVIRSGSTSRHLARNVLEQLGHSGSRTAGVILNDVDFRSGGRYYGYSGYASYGS